MLLTPDRFWNEFRKMYVYCGKIIHRAHQLPVQIETSESVQDLEKIEERSHDRDPELERSVAKESIDENRLVRKIDLRVVPVLCVLYLLAFLDR